jgi:asparagine synthase (glutamine-hydrolysing)
MTIMVGIFARNPSAPIKPEWRKSVLGALAAECPLDPQVHDDARAFFAKIDLGAYYKPAFLARPGGFAMLAGEPLVDRPEDPASPARDRDLSDMADAVAEGKPERVFRKVNGIFSAVIYDKARGALNLFADKMGTRPLYYWMDKDHLVFSTVLRILEALPWIPKVMCMRGSTEFAYFGYSFGDRTPYSTIKILRPAERVAIETGDKISRSQYWHLNEIAISKAPEAELLDEAYRRFETAVKRRLHGDRSAIAFLSGGLDSRCVVTALHTLGAKVHSFNFAPANTQDQFFGAEFAKAIGAVHTAAPIAPENFARLHWMMADAWNASTRKAEYPPERPGIVFAGGGGSSFLGLAHVSQEQLDLFRKGDVEGGIRTYLRQRGITYLKRMYRKDFFKNVEGILEETIREELAPFHSGDGAQDFNTFLVSNCNDRKPYHVIYEDIGRNRMEFQQAFYDSAFVETMVSVPIDLLPLHKFYAKWLHRFHPVLQSVAWQTYKGHVPCPLPIPENLKDQWSRENAATSPYKVEKEKILRKARAFKEAKPFPRQILNGPYLRLAAFLHRFDVGDYSYAINTADRYLKYWKLAEGRFELGR